MGIVQRLDSLPDAVVRTPAQFWSLFARSLGEQGADGRTALAWRWVLTGSCPSPVTLTSAPGCPPPRDQIIAEADAPAEFGLPGADPGGQIMQARFVLEWLAGKIDELPLWNGEPEGPHVTDGAAFSHTRQEMEAVYFWALLAKLRHPWVGKSAPAGERLAFGWVLGALDLLAWACGEAGAGPLTGRRILGRPGLREISLDVCRAMAGLEAARDAEDAMRARRLESVMETFLWLTGWGAKPPVDRHGHGSFEVCPEREAPCVCDAAARCLRGECPACWRVACVHGFGQENVTAQCAGR